jgi:hypothetical protein
MIPGTDYALELAAADLRRRALKSRPRKHRANDFAPPEWPPSRGPTPNPRHR